MRSTLIAVGLLSLGGGLHGVWSHRWEDWSAPALQARAERIEQIPLRVGDWTGERIKTDTMTLPEEQVGRGLSVRYTNKIDGSEVVVFLNCGPTDGVVSHTPRVCYPANGFACSREDLRISPPAEDGARSAEFWASHYTQTGQAGAVPVHLRVLWAWSDGTGWQAPGNPHRAFRSSTVLYKCYAIRPVRGADEPLEGDPGLRLLSALLPQLDPVLSPETR
jgi:hypothetical protein